MPGIVIDISYFQHFLAAIRVDIQRIKMSGNVNEVNSIGRQMVF